MWSDPHLESRNRTSLIIDHWNNFAYFKLNPEGETDHPTEPLPVRLLRLRLEKWLLLSAPKERPRSVIQELQGDGRRLASA